MPEQHRIDDGDRKPFFDLGMPRQIGDTPRPRSARSITPSAGRIWPTIPFKSVLFPAPLGPAMAVSEPRANAPLK
jgi:hypothetical protein